MRENNHMQLQLQLEKKKRKKKKVFSPDRFTQQLCPPSVICKKTLLRRIDKVYKKSNVHVVRRLLGSQYMPQHSLSMLSINLGLHPSIHSIWQMQQTY
jgi:hypothetical protein